MNQTELLKKAAAELSARELSQGPMAQGHKKPPPPAEVYPWVDNYEVTHLSLLGAICFAAKAAPDDPAVQAAYRQASKALAAAGVTYTPEIWNDETGRTAAEVVAVLRQAAGE